MAMDTVMRLATSCRRASLRPTRVMSIFPAILVIVGVVLLLVRLDNMYLWQDEAETALLSERMAQYGLPLAFDGHNLVRQAPQDVQYTADYVWVYHPWLPFYFTALSFVILGTNTFAARFPYALAGLATVLLLYFSLRDHVRDRRVAALGSALLLLCVPFLLHARQCKYFAFAALFTVATLDAYLRLVEQKSPGWIKPYFVVSAVCLFHSNFGAFVPLAVALAVHFALMRPSRAVWAQMALVMGLVAVMVVPWAVYLQTWARGRFAFDVYRFAGHLAHYVVYITGWVFPVPLLLWFAFLYFRVWRLRPSLREAPGATSIVNLYLAVILLTVLFLSATFIWMYFSYIVQLVPLLAALVALAVCEVLDRSRLLGYALLALLMLTNVLHTFPFFLPVAQHFKWASLAPRPYLAETDALIAAAGGLRLDVVNYTNELTHDYNGPNEGIVSFLIDQASPGDLVLANYGELPIAFYTGLDVAGGLSAFRLDNVGQPEWIINRLYGPYRDEMARIIAAGNYEAIEIPYPDLPWDNRPVPEYHKYTTVRDVPDVVINRRLD